MSAMMDGEIESGDLMALSQGKVPDTNYVKFYTQSVRMGFKSDQAGRDVFEDQPFVLILTPGQKNSEFRAKATDDHKKRYPRQWMEYESKKEQLITGTPIDMLPGVGPTMVNHLKGLNIYTVEQLAGIPEGAFANIGMGAAKLKIQAKAFVDKQNPEMIELQEKNRKLEAEMADLRKMVESMQPAKGKTKPKSEDPESPL